MPGRAKSAADERAGAQRERELHALLEIARAISSTLELGPLLDVVLEHTAEVLPYARMTILLREGDELHMRAVRAVEGATLSDELLGEVGIAIPLTATPRIYGAIRDGEPLRIDDVPGNSDMAVAYR
jgi:GAF domain-containing protein